MDRLRDEREKAEERVRCFRHNDPGRGGGAQWSFHYLRTDPKRLLVVIGF